MCEFCSGEMTYSTPYLTVKRRSKIKPFTDFTVEVEWHGCPQFGDCRADDRISLFDFNYCPNCGAKRYEEVSK